MSDVQPVVQAQHLLAVRRAALVASSSLDAILASDNIQVRDFVRMSKDHINLEMDILNAQADFLRIFSIELSLNQQMHMLFDCIDTDGSGTIDLTEFRNGLNKVQQQHLDVINELIPLVERNKEFFGENAELGLRYKEFAALLREHCYDSASPLNDLLELLVCQISFGNTSGRAVLEEVVRLLVGNRQASQEDFHRAVEEARMMLVFDVLDHYQEGRVPFRDIVKHVFRFSDERKMERSQRDILLMVEQDDNCCMEYEDFSEFLQNVRLSCTTTTTIHEICNAMTISVCKQDVTEDDMQHLFVNGQSFEELSIVTSSTVDAELLLEFPWIEAENLAKRATSNAEFGKLNRLFDLWDADHDGYLDLHEISMGMRKFQKTKSLDATVEDSVRALTACDQDHDNRLDRAEFAILLTKLARVCSLDVRRLVDFMVVQSALQDNDTQDEEYLLHTAHHKTPQLLKRGLGAVRRGSSQLIKMIDGMKTSTLNLVHAV